MNLTIYCPLSVIYSALLGNFDTMYSIFCASTNGDVIEDRKIETERITKPKHLERTDVKKKLP